MNNQKKIYWTTADGESIEISEMRTSHIVNCINFIEKKARDGMTIYYGDIWPDPWVDEEYMEGQEVIEHYEPQYTALKNELDRRNDYANKQLQEIENLF